MFGFGRKAKRLENELSRISDELAAANASNKLLTRNNAELQAGVGRITDELQNVTAHLKQADAERISFARQLNDAQLELQPARFNSNHYKTLQLEHRIVELDFPARPKHRNWSSSPHIRRLTDDWVRRKGDWRSILDLSGRYISDFLNIPCETADISSDPQWVNGWIPGLDGVLLYSLVAAHKPDVFFEVGSGNSTKFVRKAIRDHRLSTKIISVDPAPRSEIDVICDKVYRVGFEDFDLDILKTLTPNDMVFIDNSHRSFPNSDVTVWFIEALGRLPKGLLYGLHDIFLPNDYPEEWAPRFYSEQYLLACYLFGGADGDTVIFPAGFVSQQPDLIEVLDSLWKSPEHQGILPVGGSFWARKG